MGCNDTTVGQSVDDEFCSTLDVPAQVEACSDTSGCQCRETQHILDLCEANFSASTFTEGDVAEWVTRPWRECSTTCGLGSKYRYVYCTSGDEADCLEPKPDTVEACVATSGCQEYELGALRALTEVKTAEYAEEEYDAPTTTTTAAPCVDLADNCEMRFRQSKGSCSESMAEDCAKTCGFCSDESTFTDGCMDSEDEKYCMSKLEKGSCEAVADVCKKTCGYC